MKPKGRDGMAKKTGKRKVWIIVIAVVLVAAIGAALTAAVMAARKKEKTAKK